jgi:hypothetical protein
MIISFPGGAGGNWLAKVLHHSLISTNSVNFHQPGRHNVLFDLHICHELDPVKFDFLLSGTSYFNFYLNVLFKLFHHERNVFEEQSYKDAFLICVNSARFLCKFDNIKHHVYFNFDDLVLTPELFYQKIIQAQSTYKIPVIQREYFLAARTSFLNTCVNPKQVFENFDNMFWVTFVLGQLMNQDIVPSEFLIHEYHNQARCKEFAQINYYRCGLSNVHYLDTAVFMPEVI